MNDEPTLPGLRLNTAATLTVLILFLASVVAWVLDLGGSRERANMFREATASQINDLQGRVEAVRLDLDSYKREQAAIQGGIRDNLASINTTLAVINEKLLNDRRQDERLTDIETRMRKVEQRQ